MLDKLDFKVNEEKSKSANAKVYDCEVGDTTFTIIEGKGGKSVFVRRTVYVDGVYVGFMEMGDHRPQTIPEAKNVAEKLYDIVLGYKPVLIGKDY